MGQCGGWQEPEVRPAREGMYERDWGDDEEASLDYFDGVTWKFGETKFTALPNKRWREPKETK